MIDKGGVDLESGNEAIVKMVSATKGVVLFLHLLILKITRYQILAFALTRTAVLRKIRALLESSVKRLYSNRALCWHFRFVPILLTCCILGIWLSSAQVPQ